MKWATALSEHEDLTRAVDQCVAKTLGELSGLSADLAVVFVSAHHAPQYDALPDLLRRHLGGAVLVGCSGGGVIGEGREVEHRPGLALAIAHLPGVALRPFHVGDEALPDADAPPEAWEGLVGVCADDTPHFLLLADPFSLRVTDLLMGLDYAFPASVKVGGLASGGHRPGGNALLLGDGVYRAGAVGVAMHGDLAVDAVVAQGCRPIGRPLRVTACSGNILLKLDGRPPLEVLREVFQELDPRDRELARHSLFLGLVMDPFNDSPALGDFLIRNIVGLDPRLGALAIGETLKEGQTVQFHLRDAVTSSEDLEAMLGQYVGENGVDQAAGALLFSCLGRGSFLYGRPDHDTEMFRQKVGSLPLAGFFCNGEIGPVGGVTYLHGYTSAFAIFRPRPRG